MSRWGYRIRGFDLALAALAILVVSAVIIAARRGTEPQSVEEAAFFSIEPLTPTPVIYDTDMGNDIDDALALAILHALADRGECRLLAVTVSKDNAYAAPFCDAVNVYYGRDDIPVGAVAMSGVTPQDSRYLRDIVNARDGETPLYPRSLSPDEPAPDALRLHRRLLAEAEDNSMVFVVVGFSTNIARLLESSPDELSPLDGVELVRRKCRFLSIMAGEFEGRGHQEFNIAMDVESARLVFEKWPTTILVSGYELGERILYPASSVEKDFPFDPGHPVRQAYMLYQPMPYDRETWDLTSALTAVRPDRDYFSVSPRGKVEVDAQGRTRFFETVGGRCHLLSADERQIARAREAFVQLVTQPPRLRRDVQDADD